MVFTDDHPPPHVHVYGDGSAKVTIAASPVRVMHNDRLSKADVKRALDIVGRNRDLLLEAWNRYHG
jgi:hypothetical protein